MPWVCTYHTYISVYYTITNWLESGSEAEAESNLQKPPFALIYCTKKHMKNRIKLTEWGFTCICRRIRKRWSLSWVYKQSSFIPIRFCQRWNAHSNFESILLLNVDSMKEFYTYRTLENNWSKVKLNRQHENVYQLHVTQTSNRHKESLNQDD